MYIVHNHVVRVEGSSFQMYAMFSKKLKIMYVCKQEAKIRSCRFKL